MTTIRISNIVNESIVDGPGLRLVVFTQGCPHRCEKCHNPSTWDYAGGFEISIRELFEYISRNITHLHRGVTFSGGEPFEQPSCLCELARLIKKDTDTRYLDIMTYTGFVLEDLKLSNNIYISDLLDISDYLVDGRFDYKLRDISLKWRGSSNQRIYKKYGKSFKEVIQMNFIKGEQYLYIEPNEKEEILLEFMGESEGVYKFKNLTTFGRKYFQDWEIEIKAVQDRFSKFKKSK